MKQRMLLFTAVALCCCAFLVYANQLQAQTPLEKLQMLSQALNLSPQQKTQLLPILQAEAPRLEAIKNNPMLSPSQKMMQLQSVHREADPQVQSILTVQQYKQWQFIRNQEIQQQMQK